MTTISFTGVGALVSGAWFIADIGTELITGRSISQCIDEEVGKPLLDWND